MPFVSILLPYYKNEPYVFQTIKSVLRQTYQNFELIIIFDEYFKGHHPVYQKLKDLRKKDKRIKILLNKKNLGVSKSRNKGLLSSKGKYIAFIDSDDLWNKKKLKLQIDFMIKNKLKFCHTNYYVIDKYNHKIGKFFAPKELKYSQLIKSCDIGLSTVIIDRTIVKYCKFPNIKTKEDFVVWLRLAKKKIQIISLNRYLTYWRSTDNSLSSPIIQRLSDAFKVYRYFQEFNLFKTFYFTILLALKSVMKKINIYLR
jgi:teichuronic acid biosynthesis glycosyltransferase TuaG